MVKCFPLTSESYYRQLWKGVPATVFRRVKIIRLVYSFDDRDSWTKCDSWLNSEHHLYYNAIPAFVGNKCDLKSEERAVDAGLAQEIAESIGSDMVFEISAKTGQGVQEMFDAIALKIATSSAPQQGHSQTTPPPAQPRKRCLIQ